MDLDDLKTVLKEKLEAGITPLQPAGLRKATTLKTYSVIGKIKRSIQYEFAGCLLMIAMATGMWFLDLSLVTHFFCIALLLVSGVFSFYLYRLYRNIVFFEKETQSVKESLQQIIAIVTRFTRLYFQLSIALLPVVFAFGLITGYLDIAKKGLLQHFHWSVNLLLYIIAFMVIWSAIVYFFGRWYINKLYGNYLLQLKEGLEDIENG